MSSTITTGEAGILIFAASAGATLVLAFAFYLLWRDLRDEMRRQSDECRRQIATLQGEVNDLRAENKTLRDLIVANYPGAAMVLNAHGNIDVGGDATARDRVAHHG